MSGQLPGTTGMDESMRRRLAVAQDYPMMMGLGNIGAAAGIVFGAITNQATFFAIGAVFAAVGMGWYEKRYGKLRQRGANTAVVIVFAVLFAAGVMILLGLDENRPQRILLMPLLAAVGMAAGYAHGLRHVGLTAWHWLAFALLALTSLLPLFGLRPVWLRELALIAIPLVITGVVDHLRLVKALGRGTGTEEPR